MHTITAIYTSHTHSSPHASTHMCVDACGLLGVCEVYMAVIVCGAYIVLSDSVFMIVVEQMFKSIMYHSSILTMHSKSWNKSIHENI